MRKLLADIAQDRCRGKAVGRGSEKQGGSYKCTKAWRLIWPFKLQRSRQDTIILSASCCCSSLSLCLSLAHKLHTNCVHLLPLKVATAVAHTPPCNIKLKHNYNYNKLCAQVSCAGKSLSPSSGSSSSWMCRLGRSLGLLLLLRLRLSCSPLCRSFSWRLRLVFSLGVKSNLKSLCSHFMMLADAGTQQHMLPTASLRLGLLF